jgi:hypothetical protein
MGAPSYAFVPSRTSRTFLASPTGVKGLGRKFVAPLRIPCRTIVSSRLGLRLVEVIKQSATASGHCTTAIRVFSSVLRCFTELVTVMRAMRRLQLKLDRSPKLLRNHFAIRNRVGAHFLPDPIVVLAEDPFLDDQSFFGRFALGELALLASRPCSMRYLLTRRTPALREPRLAVGNKA